MGKSEPTPGPWKICVKPPNPYWRDGGTIYSVATDMRVADVEMLNGRYEANARLIAAAPDLLAALIEIVGCEVHSDFGYLCDAPTAPSSAVPCQQSPRLALAIKDAREAIVRAVAGSDTAVENKQPADVQQIQETSG